MLSEIGHLLVRVIDAFSSLDSHWQSKFAIFAAAGNSQQLGIGQKFMTHFAGQRTDNRDKHS
jgi:hypothetical protein